MKVDQAEFRAALLDPMRPRPEGLHDGADKAAGRRFDVYRNNVAVSLTEALETAFPVIRKLLGDANFRTLAGVYLRQHPPTSPLMMHYGAFMPDFLRKFQPTSNIGYLPDVATLEIALRESYHAADSTGIDPEALRAVPPERLAYLRIGLAPSARLVRSVWPVHAIWRYNTEEGAPKPGMIAEDILVARPGLDPVPLLLPPGGGCFLEALFNGENLGDAQDIALSEASDFDLATALTLLIEAGAITHFGE